MTTPLAQGYRMPAEWEKQDAMWLAWPHNKKDWPGKFAPIPWVYVEIIRHLTQHQKVRLVVRDEKQRAAAKEMIATSNANKKNVEYFIIPTDRIWLRDSGPIFVTRKSKDKPVAMIDWTFNAWAKYPNWKRDNQVPALINKKLKLPVFSPDIVMEGGALDVNGAGAILVTEECLLSKKQQRNPGFTRAHYETTFEDYLGAPHTIWLEAGIVGDDTHGHIDDIARFVKEDTIVTVMESNPKDPNHSILQTNRKRLNGARDAQGKPFTIVELPMPRLLPFEGERLPASYANFLIANGLVIVPTFNDPNDRLALNTLAECFPDREIIGIHCVDFVLGLGTLHCMSQQQPA